MVGDATTAATKMRAFRPPHSACSDENRPSTSLSVFPTLAGTTALSHQHREAECEYSASKLDCFLVAFSIHTQSANDKMGAKR